MSDSMTLYNVILLWKKSKYKTGVTWNEILKSV